jgi:hypothetical protein
MSDSELDENPPDSDGEYYDKQLSLGWGDDGKFVKILGKKVPLTKLLERINKFRDLHDLLPLTKLSKKLIVRFKRYLEATKVNKKKIEMKLLRSFKKTTKSKHISKTKRLARIAEKKPLGPPSGPSSSYSSGIPVASPSEIARRFETEKAIQKVDLAKEEFKIKSDALKVGKQIKALKFEDTDGNNVIDEKFRKPIKAKPKQQGSLIPLQSPENKQFDVSATRKVELLSPDEQADAMASAHSKGLNVADDPDEQEELDDELGDDLSGKTIGELEEKYVPGIFGFGFIGGAKDIKISDNGLTNQEIDDLMKDTRGYIGCVPYNVMYLLVPKITARGFAILNTDSSQGHGIHWVCLYWDSNQICYYDSFGHPPSKDMKQAIMTFQKSIPDHSLQKFKYNTVADQSVSTKTCGLFAMDFGKNMMRGKSFKSASGFTGSIKRNEMMMRKQSKKIEKRLNK